MFAQKKIPPQPQLTPPLQASSSLPFPNTHYFPVGKAVFCIPRLRKEDNFSSLQSQISWRLSDNFSILLKRPLIRPCLPHSFKMPGLQVSPHLAYVRLVEAVNVCQAVLSKQKGKEQHLIWTKPARLHPFVTQRATKNAPSQTHPGPPTSQTRIPTTFHMKKRRVDTFVPQMPSTLIFLSVYGTKYGHCRNSYVDQPCSPHQLWELIDCE